MAGEAERLRILEMIERGQITAQDGIRLLEALAGEADDDEQAQLASGDQQEETESTVEMNNPAADTEEAVQFTRLADEPLDPGVEAEPTFTAASPEPAVETTEAPHFQAPPEVVTPPERFDPSRLKWRSFWWIPMLVGVGITLVAALLMFAAWNAGGFGFWFACTWFPFLLGVAVMALAWASRTARWLHVRIQQKEGEKPERITISLPVPLRLTAWFLRTFGKNIPHLGNTGLDELIMALDATSPETPFYVEVNEGANGEHVEVYIG